MADDHALNLWFEPDEPLVEFPAENVTVSVPLTPVGDGLYRIDGVPVGIEAAAFGDVIEAVPGDNGVLVFVCVADPGGWRTFDYLLPPGWLDSGRGRSAIREVESRGMYWEVVSGGLLFVCVPPELDLDPSLWVRRE
jgi:hypothetical protein